MQSAPYAFTKVYDHDIPCAVCQYSVADPNAFMLPGKTHCPAVSNVKGSVVTNNCF